MGKVVLALGIMGLCFVSCANSSTPPAGGMTPNPPITICPDNPGQCSGTCCGAACVDTKADANNCGACGKSCPSGSMCVGGQCGCPGPGGTATTCGAGQTCCGTSGCKSLTSDSNNCGVCGNSCGGATCTNGTCQSPPDMAAPASGDGGSCVCTQTCLTTCFFGCCAEELLAGTCTPDPACLGGAGLGDLGP